MAITVLDSAGNPQTIETLPAKGRVTAANSLPTAASSEDKAVADAQAASLVTLAALSKAEDAAHVSGDTGVMALAVRKDTAAAQAGTDGDYSPLLTDANGRLHVLFGNTSLAVTGTFWQATQPVSLSALPALAAGTNNIGDVDVLTLPVAYNTGASSSTTQRVVAASDSPEVAALGAVGDAAWTTGNGTHTALLKAVAGAAISTTPAEVRVVAAEFETVAASQTDQMLGASGAVGDTLSGLLVIPASTSPGAVSIEYGSTNITVFAGGASSVSNLVPFWINLENIATPSGGGWEVTTGANVSVIAFGNFT